MKRCLTVICLILSPLFSFASSKELQRLDEVIRHRSVYDRNKRESIQQARFEFERAIDDESRYNSLRSLYENYRSFRIDSALIVARERLEIARRLGAPSKIASATINLAEGYARSGAVDIAIGILDTLNRERLEDYHVKYRNAVYREAYRTKINSVVIPQDREVMLTKLKALTDSALREASKTSRGYYTLTAEKLCDAGLCSEAVATVEEAERHYDFSKDPAMLSTIGNIYIKSGDRKKAIDYLTSAAILDISSGTKEYNSLITLASLLLEEGDIKRAFDYINCAFEDAAFSHANLRTAEIMNIMPAIDKAFYEAEKARVLLIRTFLIVAGVLFVICLLLLAWYIKALHSNRRMLSTIASINSSLEEKNKALAEADSLKLHYVNTLMKANSEFISRIKGFRKDIYRYLRTAQYDKALEMAKDKRNDTADILMFQGLFDEAFLSMFPDFIDKVNDFMKEKISLKEAGRLTPELRVIAMMKLNMATTEEISSLFHYSNQTVYNLRTSIRNLLAVPWETFEEKLRLI